MSIKTDVQVSEMSQLPGFGLFHFLTNKTTNNSDKTVDKLIVKKCMFIKPLYKQDTILEHIISSYTVLSRINDID